MIILVQLGNNLVMVTKTTEPPSVQNKYAGKYKITGERNELLSLHL